MTEIDIKCDLSVIKQGSQLFIMAETACMICARFYHWPSIM